VVSSVRGAQLRLTIETSRRVGGMHMNGIDLNGA
jgi:hypothetical protein